MSTLTLGLVQTATHWHDAPANQARFDDLMNDLVTGFEETVDVFVLPEMFSSGFTMQPRLVAQTMQGATLSWMKDCAQRLNAAVCGSLVIEEGGAFYNRFVWVAASGELWHYDKRHRFRMAGEHDHYAAGTRQQPIVHGGLRVLPAVCYDLRFPVWLRASAACEVMVVVANWPAARQDAWSTLLKARAIENQCYVVGVNILGEDGNGVRYAGGSCVFGPSGATELDCADLAGVFTVRIDSSVVTDLREHFPVWQDADPFELP